ncbi:hypothetical protein L1049_008281 [Liquidambar formosana]|uniref:Glutaredoxin domain-containing protein n=1 Tax=Liquidambar formosana TaxID=63359 RepID=A0AAP0S959_LIQFO
MATTSTMWFSLTSTTYGVLNLDNEKTMKASVTETKTLKRSPPREEPEVINAWELMEGLSEEEVPISFQAKKSPKSNVFLRGFADIDVRSPLKFLNQMGSPRKVKRFGGKENKQRVNGLGGGRGRSDYSPKEVLKVCNSSENLKKASPSMRIPTKVIRVDTKSDSDSGFSSGRSSLSPLFDPELLASFEKELSEEEEQIKKMVSPAPKSRKSRKLEFESILESFERKCPPGGENAVVIYTTTLRGIRKTFEDCNSVRSIIESHLIQVFERDISMDSGFKEELRGLMGTKEVKVPLVFVKGRLIGGADEVVKMEEEGKLGILFDGIPRALAGCEGCAGVRFMMCMDCNGSCKVLDEDQKKTVRCGECNENGLIQCPICC